MHYTNNYSANNTMQLPFQMRFESALKEPLLVKCNALAQLIQESIATNLKEIQFNYTTLVDDIFGVGQNALSTDWSLKHISRNFNPREFDAIYYFLQPEGHLFQLIRQLMNDPLNRYEFPKASLPMPTRLAIEESTNIPPIYNNKLLPSFPNAIVLNAFEYFLFRFATHMLNNAPMPFGHQSHAYLEQLSNVNTNPQNIVYFTLLESYLNYFVPLSSKQIPSHQSQSSQSSLWQSLSSTTSNFLHLSTPSHSTNQEKASTPQTSTLFKSSILNLKPLLSGTQEQQKSEQQMTHQLIHDSLGSEIAKCEIFLLIVAEMWLNHAIPHSTAKRQNSPPKQYTFTPTSDHMRAVRILVKHLHYFANSCAKRGNDPINLLNVTPLDDIKQSIWSPKYLFQKKLYTFLRLSFERWPNDTSFRLPLETWLSYIQPWRYINYTSGSAFDEIGTEVSVTPLDHRWKQFIADNLLFYSVIFRQLVPRFSRLFDLSSSKNALMLFRLTKVFSQTNLAEWIREAENSMMTNDASMSHLLQSSPRPSLLTPTIRHQNLGSLSTPMRHPLMELEANNFQYIPLFCPAIKPLIQQLLIEINRALNTVNDTLSKAQLSEQLAKSSSLSFIQYITSLFQFTEDTEQSNENLRIIAEKNKTRQHLKNSAEQLHDLFEIPVIEDLPDMLSPTSNQHFQSNDDTDIYSPRSSELFEERNGTPKLTSYGRSQVLNRQLKPQLNIIEGNPDKQPVRTYEFYYMVQFCIWISDLINRKYERTFQQLYHKPGFVGVFFRQLITGPTQYIRTVKSENSYRPPERITEVLGPRINLRFAANKAYIFYTFLLYFFVYLLKISLIYFTSLLIAMYFTYLTTKSLLIHLSSY